MRLGLFPSIVQVRREFNLALSENIPETLERAGFKSVRVGKRGSLPTSWYRDRAIIIDGIIFQWDKYNWPSVVINFRSFAHPEDIENCRKNPKDILAWDFGLSSLMKPSMFGSFKVSYSAFLFNRALAIGSVVEKMKISIADIDHVMMGGTAKTPMVDSSNWLDPRLPDNPPPWTEAGKVGSSYHLPPYRVGSGCKLATWEL
jgi:hypothetical protein